ncbi:hypothetical protein ASG88_04005 [Nocardioides sp. Soil777]|uniref:hypothetical protein n=1 Tax=Nocardioides sp. Soil777 TaxID=1736409 RepID=UPI00070291C3|nr:hypothetical protein [Nocardioides sp. Soil777]KRF02547.1 hypothetical protein ASG88_04005 [Nocardioides sp. Soil777]
MDTKWAQEIERSFGDGPTPPAPATYVEAGRAAVRRRRLTAGAASVAAALVIGGVGWAALPGDPRADAGQVATDPSPTTEAPSPSPSETAAAGVPIRRVPAPGNPDAPLAVQWVEIDGEGLTVLQGVEVKEVVANPLDFEAPQQSFGVALVRDAEERWMVLTGENGRSSSATWDDARKRHATFADWLVDQVEFDRKALEESPVFLDRRGVLGAYANVTVLQEVRAPAEAAAYAPVEDTAAVEYRTPRGDVVFALLIAGGDATTVDPAVLETPTMAAFLRHLAAQGDSGEGLR